MQILSIQLKNIKSHRDTELNFSAGINVLSGPNGIGKSTIFEAIGYTLFGVDAQSFVGNVERFISIGAKKGEITVVIQLADDQRFRVSRTVGTPSKWLLAKEVSGDFEVEEHKDAKETEARLKDLLGLDNGRSLAEQFELVIGPFQHEFLGPFVIKQTTRRRDKFDEILGIDTWRKTFTETKILASAIKSKVESLQSAIGPLKDQLAVLPEKSEAENSARQELGETRLELQKKQQQLQQLAEQLVASDQREQQLQALKLEIDVLCGRIDNGREKIDNQRKLIGAAEIAQKIVTANEAGKAAFEQVENRLAGLRERLKLQRQLEGEVAAIDKQVASLGGRFSSQAHAVELAEKDLAAEEQLLADKRELLAADEQLQTLAVQLPEIRSGIAALRTQLGQLEGRRAGLEEGSDKLAEGVCPFLQEPCLNVSGKPAGDLFAGKFSKLKVATDQLTEDIVSLEKQEVDASRAAEQIKAHAIQLQGLQEQSAKLIEKRTANQTQAAALANLQQEQQAAQRLLLEKQQQLQTYAQLQTDIDAAEKEKQRHQPARDLYLANQQQAAELERYQAELQKYQQLLADLQTQRQGKETDFKQSSLEYDADRHQALRQQKDALGQQVGALGQKVENLNAEIVRLAGEIEKLKQLEVEINTKQDLIKKYAEKDELVKFLRNRVFRNVSAYLSERFREEISQRANSIYRIIAEVDEELAWGDNYQIVLRDMVDGELRERIDDQLSGGQTMSAVVALRLAMLQTIGARIAFFDEPTSNLDATRRENLAHAFRAIDVGKEELTEHWYDQLFLISHDVAFTEVTDQIISLEA